MRKNHSNLVERYYEIAPQIVKAIDSSKEREAMYNEIWNHFLKPAYNLVRVGKNSETMSVYSDMVYKLEKEYIGDKPGIEQLRKTFKNGKFNISQKANLEKLSGKSEVQVLEEYSSFNDKWYKYIDIGN